MSTAPLTPLRQISIASFEAFANPPFCFNVALSAPILALYVKDKKEKGV